MKRKKETVRAWMLSGPEGLLMKTNYRTRKKAQRARRWYINGLLYRPRQLRVVRVEVREL